MAKLISSIVAIVLATATLATAAPRQGAVRKSATAARAKAVKTSKPAYRKAHKTVPAKYRKTTTTAAAAPKPATTTVPKPIATVQKPFVQEDFRYAKHDVNAEEQALKRLKANIKTSEKAGDWRRASRDRREMYRLEADVRADKADLKDDKRSTKSGVRKRSRIPFWGWWRS